MPNFGNYKAAIVRRERVLPVRGVEYCVYEWGDEKAPLFFYLHGWADTGSTFQFVVDALASGWRIVAPDWRGFGRTTYRSDAYWFPDYLADLHELLAHYSPDAPVRLVGHSMGGNIASLYAGTMPERVSALINIEGFGLNDSDPAEAPQRYRDWIESRQAGPTFADYPDFGSLARRIKKRSPGISQLQAEFVAREWAREEADGMVRLRADPNHKLPNPVLYRRAEAEACWERISAAILLIYGDQSSFAGPMEGPRSLPFPDAQSCCIVGSGHMIHFEAPQILAEQIERFLQKPL